MKAVPAARLVTRPFVLAFLASLLQGMALHTFVHLPGFLEQLGATEVTIGAIFAVLALVAVASRPFVGMAMDRRGRRIVILTGAVLHVLVCALYWSIDGLGAWVFAVRGLHGLVEALIFSSLFTYAADIVPETRRTEGIALFGVSGLVPMAVAGLLGDAVLARAGYTELFAVAVGFALLGLIASIPLPEPEVPAHAEPARGFLATILEPRLLPVWALGLIFATALSSVFVFLKTFVLSTGVGSVGGFFAAYAASAVVLRLGFGWVPDRVGAVRALYPAVLLMGAGLALLSLSTSAPLLIAAGALCGFGHGFAFPILAGLVVGRARGSERGSAMSVFTALFHTGMLIGGPLFGATITELGYPGAYALAAVLCAAGAVGFALLERRAEALSAAV